MYQLDRSKFCTGRSCAMKLWLEDRKKEHRDGKTQQANHSAPLTRYLEAHAGLSATAESRMESSRAVRRAAMNRFPGCVEIPWGETEQMVQQTQTLLADNIPTLAGATFLNREENLLCRVDLLRNLGDGRVEIWAVKGSTSVSEQHLDDVSFQHYVLTGLGYQVAAVRILYLNNRYVRHGDLDFDALFCCEDVQALHSAESVANSIRKIRAFVDQSRDTLPEPCHKLGDHCFSPHPCDGWAFCTQNLPLYHIFHSDGLNKAIANKLDHDFHSLDQLSPDDKFWSRYKTPLEFEIHQNAPLIDPQAIRDLMPKTQGPLYFLDFESYQATIPPFDGTKPFTQITFQYSLDWVDSQGAWHHSDFLHRDPDDPRKLLAQQLCRDIPKNAPVIAYHKQFEADRISELAALCPELSGHLMAIHGNLWDLEVPFRKKYYYVRQMGGSASIKYVLPALFPDDPDLSYTNLEGVRKGDQASAAYVEMVNLPPEERDDIYRQLLTYCRLDTRAMVRVWQKLQEAIGEPVDIRWHNYQEI